MTEVELTRENVLQYCAQSSSFPYLRSVAGGNKVVKLNSHIVVKFGCGATEGEAVTQHQMCKMLDPSIIYVPHVHGFYRDDAKRIGYIVMDFVDGQTIDIHNTAHIKALRRAFQHLASFQRDLPGPLHSDELDGIFWDDARPVDHTLQGLESFINDRQNEKIALKGVRCVLCHLDTALENILWLLDGAICLLDWASAGYYPRYFELAAHLKKGQPDELVQELLSTPLEPFSDEERQQMNCLIQACANSMRYAQPRSRNSPLPDNSPHYLQKQPSLSAMATETSFPRSS